MINYYEVLQIDPKADVAVIRAAYRTLMKDLGKHPDKGGDTDTAKIINEAYEHLTDPVKRDMIDKRLRLWTRKDETAHQTSLLVRCIGCNVINRIEIAAIERYSAIRCGNCASLLPCGKHAPQPVVHRSVRKLTSKLKENNWIEIGEKESYFDSVLKNSFFMKNFIYIKKVKNLCPANAAAVFDNALEKYNGSFSLNGYYFIFIADRLDFISCIIESCKESMQKMKGFGPAVIIPVDLERKQVFLSHINLNHHPADIFNLRSHVFSD